MFTKHDSTTAATELSIAAIAVWQTADSLTQKVNNENTIFWLVMLTLALTACAYHTPEAATPVSFHEIATIEHTLVAMVNELRQQSRLPVLLLDARAQTLARRYSLDMWQRNFFSHRDPDARLVQERLLAAGISFDYAAENLGKVANGVLVPTELIHAWLASPAHRRNIFASDFTHTAVGIYYSRSQVYYITQIFLHRSRSFHSKTFRISR